VLVREPGRSFDATGSRNVLANFHVVALAAAAASFRVVALARPRRLFASSRAISCLPVLRLPEQGPNCYRLLQQIA
jgi:hypothetical protein